jgi:ParB family chromosome partitioning protein
MITSVPLSALLPPKDNPRRTFDKKSIEGLAQSIKKDGLIHNLTVKPEGSGKYRVVAGQRRFLALQHLAREGAIERTYKVPIRVDKKATAGDLDRIAAIENVQREHLDPIDEADAFAKLLRGGAKIEHVSAETGVSVQIIKRRVALADLAPEVKDAVRQKAVSLSVAEALTLARAETQKAWLKDLKRNPGIDARYLRSRILEEKPSAAVAVFPLEKYQGTYTKDLFAEKDATYFDDREQFMTLQREAVEGLAEQHRANAAWVEVNTDHSVSWWQYRQAKKKEQSGVVIHFAPTGRVEVRQGLVRQDVDQKATKATGAAKKPKQRPAVSKATYRYANAHKTVAVQMALLGNARMAKETAAMILLCRNRVGAQVSLRPHDALREVGKDASSSKAYGALEATAGELLGLLGASQEATEEAPAWLRLLHLEQEWPDLLAAVRSLTAAQLDTLIALLLILCFGTEAMEAAEPAGTLLDALSNDAAVVMRDVWTPDEVFLGGLRRDDLVKVAGECGALRMQPSLGNGSKKELVQGLVRYFKRTADPSAQLDEHERRGRVWLPACMQCGASAGASGKNGRA